jgi:hypothetical protein
VINYTIQQYNGLDSADDVKVIVGTVTCDKDGNYSDGGLFVGSNPPATGIKITLDPAKIDCNATANIFFGTVAQANTAEVLGADYPSDVDVVLTQSQGKIVSASYSYVDASGNNVEILCMYN